MSIDTYAVVLYAYVFSVSLYTAFIMVPSDTFYGLSLLLSCLLQNYAVLKHIVQAAL